MNSAKHVEQNTKGITCAKKKPLYGRLQGWRLKCEGEREQGRKMISKVPLDGTSFNTEKFTKMLSMQEFQRVGTFIV